MALSGRFDADFNEFFQACKEAELSLKGFDAGVRQVEGSLNRMVDDFTGRKIISEATLMAEAVTRIGSPARLTADELQHMGAVADEAIEKLRRIGGDVPPKFQALADAAARARGSTDGLGNSLRQFDGVLSVMGINLGPEIRGIEDIAKASGKTAAQLGLLATAGLTVGAGVGGWKIGSLVSDFFDLDVAIGNAIAKARGWGNVAGETAGAKADVLARASKTAGHAITDVTEAMRINQAEAERQIAANIKTSDSFKKEADEAARAALVIESNRLKAFKVEHDFAVAKTNWDAAEAARLKQAEADKQAQFHQEMDQVRQSDQAFRDKNIALSMLEIEARKEIEKNNQALRDQAISALSVQRAITSVTYDLSTESGRKRFRELNPSASLSPMATPEYFQTHTIEDAIRDGLLDLYAGFRKQGATYGMVGGWSGVGSGIPPLSGSLMGDERTTVQPLVAFPGPQGYGPVTLHVTVSNSGVFDTSSARKLADIVGDAVMTKFRIGRQVGAN